MDEQLRVEFNEWARAGRGESMERGHRPTGEQAIARMDVPPDAVVLDLGCGSGWASRLLASRASKGSVIGIDISDKMIELARKSSASYSNVTFEVAGADHLPFLDQEFTHAFSMESLYYYEDMAAALSEVARVLRPGGLFASVMDLYFENAPSHQWIDQLKVPVHLLPISEYHSLFKEAGFTETSDERLLDPTPVPDDYAGGSFKTREDLLAYRAAGSLLMLGKKPNE